ncbi:MAG: hypothetical protein QXU01_04165 [Candidatus Hadarchaeales archaeon]
MSRKNIVFREILYRTLELDEPYMTQKSIAEKCQISLDTVNKVVRELHRFHGVEKKPMGFRVINVQKVLTYWACTRDLHKDICFLTYVPHKVKEIESELPSGTIFTAFSGYARRIGETSMYSEVYVYGDPQKISTKFPKRESRRPNLVVLEKDSHIESVSQNQSAPIAQIYVDLWQIGTQEAEKLLVVFDEKIRSRKEIALKGIVEKMRSG